MNRTKATNKFELSTCGIMQCDECGKLQPSFKYCKRCGHDVDQNFYSKPIIPTAKMKEVPFGSLSHVKLAI